MAVILSKPALTPDEWAAMKIGSPHYSVERRYLLGGTDLTISSPGIALYEQAHGVAALALHGQPFGFTWDMVDSLRLIADAVEGVAHDNHVARVRETADRIAALLPPRP